MEFVELEASALRCLLPSFPSSLGESYHCTLLQVIKKSELPCSYHDSFRFLITLIVPCRDFPSFNSPLQHFYGIPVLKHCTLPLFAGLFPCIFRDFNSHLICQHCPKASVLLNSHPDPYVLLSCCFPRNIPQSDLHSSSPGS